RRGPEESACKDRLLLPREAFEQRYSVFGAWQRGHLVANSFGVASVGGVAENRLHRVADRFRCSLSVLDHSSDPERGAALSVEWLISIDWNRHHGQATTQCSRHGAVAGMGDH